MALAMEQKGSYTYQDYVTWPDNERWELIQGQPYGMTPAPIPDHQRVAGRFYARLEASIEGTPCIPFIAPLDVVLSDHDVVQPDVLVVCDQTKITRSCIRGAPDLIVEVASPSTALKDRREKKALYERYGVKEYIIADPDARYIERFVLQPDGTYGKSEILGHEETLALHSLEGVTIALKDLFLATGPH